MYRVLRITNRLNLGGPTYNVAYLTKYLNNDFETLLVAGNTDESEESSAFIIESLGIHPRYIDGMYRELHPWRDRKALAEIRKIIREYRPHIVHTHAAKAGALGRMAAWLENIPVVVHTFHGHVFHSYFGPTKTRIFLEIERFLAKRTDKIITLSQLQKDELSLQFKVAAPEKFAIIPLGFDLTKFTENTEEKRNTYRARYQIKEDEIAIGIIGRLVLVKNHAFFLDVIRLLYQKTQRKIRAIIIGGGEERNNLEILASEKGLPFNIETDTTFDKLLLFTSWEKNIDQALAGLDIVALTSLNEGTPVSLIEASAAGKAIVTTDVGGIKNVLKENVNALIAAKDDINGFTDKLLSVVEDDDLRNAMGLNGRTETLATYSYQRLCEDMGALYLALLKEKGIS